MDFDIPQSSPLYEDTCDQGTLYKKEHVIGVLLQFRGLDHQHHDSMAVSGHDAGIVSARQAEGKILACCVWAFVTSEPTLSDTPPAAALPSPS